MRIAISGTAGQGKSTLIKTFIHKWDMYRTPAKTYRDVIKEKELPHSTETTTETQLMILDAMTKAQEKHKDEEFLIYDRCAWDNLAYSLEANERDEIADEVMAVIIDVAKASFKNIDIIFWLKYDPETQVVDDSLRETDIEYIKKIDSIFEDLYKQFLDHLGETPFYIPENCPAIIPIEGKTLDDRVNWVGEFVDSQGNLVTTDKSILDPENIEMMEQMIKEQEVWTDKDAEYNKVVDNIKNIDIDAK